MIWGTSGSPSRVEMAGGAGRGAPGRLGSTVLGILVAGLFGFFCAPGVLPATWQQGSVAGADVTPAANLQAIQNEDTLISNTDLLFIQVFDVEQMTREYRVSTTGTIDFPLLADPIMVAGLSPRQAAEVISKKCIAAGVLMHPQVSVTVRESRLHSVSVSGSVKNPQVYPVFGHVSLMDLLTLAGGVSDDAGPVVTVARGEISRRLAASKAGEKAAADDPPSAPDKVNIHLQRLLDNSDPALNVDIYPGDRVTIQRAGVVYVLGAVNHAGGYLLSDARQNMTVLKAVALAGYLNTFAKSKSVVLLRVSPSAPNGRAQIPINLKAMLKGDIPDTPMQNNDILFVPDSSVMKALHRGADIAAMGVTYAGSAAIM